MRYGQTKDVAELKCFGRAFLQINKCTIVAVSLVVAGTATANTQFCTQDQKQLVNNLLEQNEDPAKSCYRAANGDITTLVTSRLCPLPACVAWLEYMAAKAPDCYYDSTNYATAYTAKSADCAG
ncbi:hypothetical protein PF010_g420 [Phytophthora fragariae]|uniref:Elicitin n=1 Tax=Phytophthora fragariae TaxID=53985 RepID=A0A6G0M2X0_9STRA|nr:hypothetical protein PF010_g420 [Phytophthora fragariae]KAE9255883.1 hypothetical protein PF004_g382 [Phytophthora fragariae]